MYLARGSAHISVGKHVYRQEAQHTCCAAKKYVQHSLFANKLQNVNLSEAMFCKHRQRQLAQMCFFKAVYGLLATSDSIWYQIYSYHDIGNQRMAKQALEKAVNQRQFLRESKMNGHLKRPPMHTLCHSYIFRNCFNFCTTLSRRKMVSKVG